MKFPLNTRRSDQQIRCATLVCVQPQAQSTELKLKR